MTDASDVVTAMPCTFWAAYTPATDVLTLVPATVTGADAAFDIDCAKVTGADDELELLDESLELLELLDDSVELTPGSEVPEPDALTVTADAMTIDAARTAARILFTLIDFIVSSSFFDLDSLLRQTTLSI